MLRWRRIRKVERGSRPVRHGRSIMIDMGLRPDAVASARAVTAGYKVNISRGDRIGRVWSECFSRPDDERFLSLCTLHAAARTRS
jgi:hypothetical protein